MPDYIGNIPVPEVIPSGVFPLVPDFPHGRTHQPEVIVYQFGSANTKIATDIDPARSPGWREPG